jgi:hypothetical protein
VKGVISISTILLVDVKIGGLPPYIYICTNSPMIRHTQNYYWKFQLENLNVVN